MSATQLAIQIRPPGGRLFGPAVWVTWPLTAGEPASDYQDLRLPDLTAKGRAEWIRSGDETAVLARAQRFLDKPPDDRTRAFLSLPSNLLDEALAERLRTLIRTYPTRLRLGVTLLRQDAALLAGYGQAVIEGYGLDFQAWCEAPAIRAAVDYPLLFERLDAPANDIVQCSEDALGLRRSLRGLLLPALSTERAEAIDRQAPRFIEPAGLSFLARLMAGGLATKDRNARRDLQSVTTFLREARSAPIEGLRIPLPARLRETLEKDNERLSALCGAKLRLPESPGGPESGDAKEDDHCNAIFLSYLQHLGKEVLEREEALGRLQNLEGH